MTKRKSIRSETLAAVAEQLAGQPIDSARAAAYAEYAEPIYQMLEGLRALPLKDIEPAIVFTPIDVDTP